jgi:hypothetical protein
MDKMRVLTPAGGHHQPPASIMSIPEQRTARLILLAILKEIGPEELLELQEGYLSVSVRNRQKFKQLTSKHRLLKSVRGYYQQKIAGGPSGDK